MWRHPQHSASPHSGQPSAELPSADSGIISGQRWAQALGHVAPLVSPSTAPFSSAGEGPPLGEGPSPRTYGNTWISAKLPSSVGLMRKVWLPAT